MKATLSEVRRLCHQFDLDDRQTIEFCKMFPPLQHSREEVLLLLEMTPDERKDFHELYLPMERELTEVFQMLADS